MELQERWSFGILVGVPIWIAFMLIFVALIAYGVWYGKRNDDAYSDGGMWGRSKFIVVYAPPVLFIIFAIGLAALYPYSGEYHKWTRVQGEVEQISSRILGTNGDVNQRFVVVLDGIGERSCDDTRCSLIEEGDILTLDCKRHWQFSGTDGYDCNFVERQEQ